MHSYWFFTDSAADAAQNIYLDRIQQAQAWEDAADLGIAAQVGALGKLCEQQAKEIARLEVALEVMTGILTEYEILQQDDLSARFKARWDTLRETAERQAVRCSSCGAEVPKGETYFGASGEVCASCADL
jgi:hypothetical protein